MRHGRSDALAGLHIPDLGRTLGKRRIQSCGFAMPKVNGLEVLKTIG
jgi:hypothetical protein